LFAPGDRAVLQVFATAEHAQLGRADPFFARAWFADPPAGLRSAGTFGEVAVVGLPLALLWLDLLLHPLLGGFDAGAEAGAEPESEFRRPGLAGRGPGGMPGVGGPAAAARTVRRSAGRESAGRRRPGDARRGESSPANLSAAGRRIPGPALGDSDARSAVSPGDSGRPRDRGLPPL